MGDKAKAFWISAMQAVGWLILILGGAGGIFGLYWELYKFNNFGLGLGYMFGAWLGGFICAISVFVFANIADDVNQTKHFAESMATAYHQTGQTR